MSRIKILNSSLVEQGIIPGVFSSSRTEKLNSDNVLSFSVPLNETNNVLVVDGNVAEADDDYFDIVYSQKCQNAEGELVASVECEHVSYRLNDADYDLEYFAQTGTPTAILTQILSGTDFTVGTVEFTDSVTYSSQEKMSRRLLLMDFIAYLGGEISCSKFEISILQHRGSTDPKNLLSGRNIDVLSKTFDKRQKDASGNPLVSYGCSLIHPMDIALGDVVTMGYPKLDINVQLRIVSITTNPYNKYEASFEVGNFVSALEDEARRIETTALTKGKAYYGARISPENGFESIRSDKMARGVFNAETFALQKGDGTGDNWTNKLYFDPTTGEYVFDGTLSANVIKALQEIVVGGGDVDLGSGAEIYDSETNPTIHITKDLIDVLDGKIRIRDHTGNSVILNSYGIDTTFVKYFKNYVYNSQFEIYDKDTKRPYYWSAGVASKDENFFGTVSLMLEPGQNSQAQNYEINPQEYSDVSYTRISFYRKGTVKIEVLDELGNPYTLTDNNGNSGTSLTAPDQSSWLNSRYTFNFSHGAHTNCVIKFTNAGSDNCFIDAVQLEPDVTGMWSSFYTDGPESFGDGSGDKVTKVSQYSVRNTASKSISTADIDIADIEIDFKKNSLVEISCTCILNTSNITDLQARYKLWDSINEIYGSYNSMEITELYPGIYSCKWSDTINPVSGVWHLTAQVKAASGTGTVDQNDFLMEVTVYEGGGNGDSLDSNSIKSLSVYSDGMAVVDNENATTKYSFTKDTDGRITCIKNLTTNIELNISWNSTQLPL